MTFFPQGSHQVRQFGQHSTHGGKTWQVPYDLTCVRTYCHLVVSPSERVFAGKDPRLGPSSFMTAPSQHREAQKR